MVTWVWVSSSFKTALLCYRFVSCVSTAKRVFFWYWVESRCRMEIGSQWIWIQQKELESLHSLSNRKEPHTTWNSSGNQVQMLSQSSPALERSEVWEDANSVSLQLRNSSWCSEKIVCSLKLMDSSWCKGLRDASDSLFSQSSISCTCMWSSCRMNQTGFHSTVYHQHISKFSHPTWMLGIEVPHHRVCTNKDWDVYSLMTLQPLGNASSPI